MTAISEVLGPEQDSPFAGSVPPVSASHPEFSFTCPRFQLALMAARAGNVVPSREGHQMVLNNFAIQATAAPPRLEITGTDLELRVITSTPAVQLSFRDLSQDYLPLLMLPAKRFQAILSEAPDGDVTVSVKGDRAIITAGSASWELLIPSDGSDYPRAPDLTAVEWHDTPRVPLLSALRTVRHAVSKGGTKPNLSQVDIRARETDGVPCVTAADGTRFAQIPLPGFPVEMRIPAAGSPAASDELIRLLMASESDTVRVGKLAKSLFFGVDSTVFRIFQLPLEYPDIWKLLLEPTLANTDLLKIGRDDLRRAISRVRINADDGTHAIGLQLCSGRVTVFTRDSRGNRAEQTVEATWDLPERTLLVNHLFLTEMLGVHPSGECVFRLGKDSGKKRSVVLLRDEESGITGIINQMSGSLAGA
jgi:DNA polymerase III sliding clamp (beta) subunit (PCNA family)